MQKRTDILERKQEILKWIEEKQSKAYMAKQLNCKQSTLNNYLQKMGISYQGQQGWAKNKTTNQYMTAKEYIENSNNIKSYILKQKLIRDGLKKNECEICHNSIWQGEKLILELHHKDGNHYNNNLDNLQIVCPNCHSILPHYCGSKTNKELKQQQNTIINKKELKKKQCLKCGKLISNKATLCRECYHKTTQKTENDLPIDRVTLKEKIRNLSFAEISREYNVSTTTIRRWCKKLKLPDTKTEINKLDIEKWLLI